MLLTEENKKLTLYSLTSPLPHKLREMNYWNSCQLKVLLLECLFILYAWVIPKANMITKAVSGILITV